jgi:general L-amino acid transport system permease protein
MGRRARNILIQAIAMVLVAGVLLYLADNAITNMAHRQISSGFGFLGQPAGFGVSMALIPFGDDSTYARAFLVALLNTMLVSAVGIALATVFGFAIGIARLSRNWLIARLAGAYVEVVRNVPLLLQIFVWYFAVLRSMPPPRQSLSLLGVMFFNNRGIFLPVLRLPDFTWDVPTLRGFNFTGGMAITPEFAALTVALSVYTASFIAENVRSGILSVRRGQIEAAHAIGLSRGQSLRFVVMPQALRVIVPPLTSQYLNLIKNSSLGAAIAYPELIALFGGTVLNQTGQAIEVIAITMAVYLLISLAVSAVMNRYNRSIRRIER